MPFTFNEYLKERDPSLFGEVGEDPTKLGIDFNNPDIIKAIKDTTGAVDWKKIQAVQNQPKVDPKMASMQKTRDDVLKTGKVPPGVPAPEWERFLSAAGPTGIDPKKITPNTLNAGPQMDYEKVGNELGRKGFLPTGVKIPGGKTLNFKPQVDATTTTPTIKNNKPLSPSQLAAQNAKPNASAK